MEFEFDPAKSDVNKAKHGIDFIEAQTMWDDTGLTILPSKYLEEMRYLGIGVIESVHWTVIFTERDSAIRLISVRRSRENEKAIYEQNQ